MRVRRQGGATLGLVAACVFFVIVIGVGFYFLSKIIGGGREVANATDAGALNVAKQALKRGAVPVSTLSTNDQAEFGGLAPNGQITLLNYNRLVAQAMMVAANADKEGTPQAKANAQATANAVKAIGASLKSSLATAAAGSLGADFNAIASNNNTKMWNGSAVACITPITQGYLKMGGSTNVIFDPATINSLNGFTPQHASVDLSSSNKPGTQDTNGYSVGNNAQYMPGYVPNTFLGGTVSLTAVPVFPNTKPHLVDIGAFKQDLTNFNAPMAADNSVPPNAFLTNAQAVKSEANSGQSSVACAVVGVLTNDYKASFSRGFVRISNGPDAVQTNGSFGVPISDGTNDIFNNQLFNGTGISQDPNSSVFTTTPAYLTMWANFNNRNGSYDNSSDPRNAQAMANAGITGKSYTSYGTNTTTGIAYAPGQFVPLSDLPNSPDPLHDMADPATASNFDANEGGLRAGSNCNAPLASITDLEKIGLGGAAFPCNYNMYDDGLTGPCAQVNNIQTWQSNYACTGLTTGGSVATSGPHQGVTNVEYMKAELLVKIAGRLGGTFCSDVSIPSQQPSGVKLFSAGVPGTPGSGATTAVAFDPSGGPNASNVVNFETVGTPWDYLNQISGSTQCGSGSSSGILEQITARCQQIDSSISSGSVKTAMQSSQLHLKGGSSSSDNGTLYLYVDPSDRSLKMASALPSGWTDSTAGNVNSFPDGNAPTLSNGECTETYPLNGWVVDTSAGVDGRDHGGDAHYHAEPFTSPTPNMSAPTYNTSLMNGSPDIGSAQNPSNISGQDAAIWKPSSGSQNLLGELKFQENTQGTTFCKPN
jgi:hypothetical protein